MLSSFLTALNLLKRKNSKPFQVEAERKALQTKRALVARRRELLSELTVRKEKEESSRKAEIKAREKEEQTKRQREEARKREIELARKQIEAVRKDEAKKYAQTLVVKGILKANDIQVSIIADICLLLYLLTIMTVLPEA